MSSIEKQNELRERCRQANAICMLEGWLPSQDFLERQERYIRGEITADELLDEVLAKAQRIKNELPMTSIAQKDIKIAR